MSQTTHLRAALRVRLTAADPDYVGSLTLPADICARLSMFHRQLAQVTVERTGSSLWTYIIEARGSAVCLNGAAARLARPGDVVLVHSYARHAAPDAPRCTTYDALADAVDTVPGCCGGLVDFAVGKIHRPRVTGFHPAAFPCVSLDARWLADAGIAPGEQVHLVNVHNGRRDVLAARAARPGSRACDVSVPGDFYARGDVVIVIAYAAVHMDDVVSGALPEFRICFPFEVPETERERSEKLLRGV